MLISTAYAQVETKLSFGNVAKLGVEYKNFEIEGIKHLSTSTKYPFIIGNINYHYKFAHVGYGTQGFSWGVTNQYKQYTIDLGMSGKYGMATLGITSLPNGRPFWLTNNDLASIALQIISGAADGLNQSIVYHGYGAGHPFWDYSTSWKRKYKDYDHGDMRDAFPFSKTALVMFTDGNHLSRAIEHFANTITVVVCLNDVKNIHNWKRSVLKGVGLMTINRLSFTLFYNNVFK